MILHSLLDFPENEGDSRKLKKRSINYEANKRKGKKKNCSLQKSETNFYKMCMAMLGKMSYIYIHIYIYICTYING